MELLLCEIGRGIGGVGIDVGTGGGRGMPPVEVGMGEDMPDEGGGGLKVGEVGEREGCTVRTVDDLDVDGVYGDEAGVQGVHDGGAGIEVSGAGNDDGGAEVI